MRRGGGTGGAKVRVARLLALHRGDDALEVRLALVVRLGHHRLDGLVGALHLLGLRGRDRDRDRDRDRSVRG